MIYDYVFFFALHTNAPVRKKGLVIKKAVDSQSSRVFDNKWIIGLQFEKRKVFLLSLTSILYKRPSKLHEPFPFLSPLDLLRLRFRQDRQMGYEDIIGLL